MFDNLKKMLGMGGSTDTNTSSTGGVMQDTTPQVTMNEEPEMTGTEEPADQNIQGVQSAQTQTASAETKKCECGKNGCVCNDGECACE